MKPSTTSSNVGYGAFVVAFLILSVSNIISTAIGYHYSIDMKGWWVVALCFTGALSFIYTLTLLGISKLARHFTTRSVVFHAITISVANTLFSLVYYVWPPDWGAISQGRAVLTPLQNFVHSDASFFLMWGFCLGLALVHAIILRVVNR